MPPSDETDNLWVDVPLQETYERLQELGWDLRPDDILRPSRHPSKVRVRRRAGVVFVAALIVLVFFVPLPHLSLFNRLSQGDKAIAPGSSTVPVGWVPVALGSAQIAVPDSWSVVYNAPDCPIGRGPGELFVNPYETNCNPSAKLPTNLVMLSSLVVFSYKSFKVEVINGITVYNPSPNSGRTPILAVPSLGVSIWAEGPLSRRVLHTIARSPRAVVLGSGRAPVTPSSWRTLSFKGLRFAVPADWPVERISAGYWYSGPIMCTGIIKRHVTPLVILSGDKGFATCYWVASPQIPRDGLEITSESRLPTVKALRPVFSTHCFSLNDLSVCPATSPAYSILVLRVAVPGRSRPVIVSIGLAGNGMIARTILYSLRPAAAGTPECQSDQITAGNGNRIGGANEEASLLVTLKNSGRVPCTLKGYPTVRLVTSTGTVLDLRQTTNAGLGYVTTAAPRPVILEAGAKAYVLVAKLSCTLGNLRQASQLHLILPGASTGKVFRVSLVNAVGSFALCKGGSNAPGNQIAVSPVEPAVAGTLPVASAPTTTTVTGRTTVPCKSSQLHLAVARMLGRAMSQDGLFFSYTNVSNVSCSLDGYPRLQVYGQEKRSMLTRLAHGGDILFSDPGPRLVTLVPRASAYFGFSWPSTGQPNVSQTGCIGNATVSSTPPDSSTSSSVSLNFAKPPLTPICKGVGGVTAVALRDAFAISTP